MFDHKSSITLFVVPALFSGCPITGRKFSNPETEEMTSSVTTWSSCSLTCQARADCTGWAWDRTTETCSTMSGSGGQEEAANFISGRRDCVPTGDLTGWLSCAQNNPYNAASQGSRYEVGH